MLRKQCQEIGIKGENIKSEIISLAKDLPESYERICEDAMTSDLPGAVQLYQSVVKSKLDEGIDIKVESSKRFIYLSKSRIAFKFSLLLVFKLGIKILGQQPHCCRLN